MGLVNSWDETIKHVEFNAEQSNVTNGVGPVMVNFLSNRLIDLC